MLGEKDTRDYLIHFYFFFVIENGHFVVDIMVGLIDGLIPLKLF